MSRTIKDHVSIVLAGEAGQGIQSIETVLTGLLKQAAYHVFSTRESMSRVRGGMNSVEIVVSSRAEPAYVDRVDILVPLAPGAIPHVSHRMDAHTLVIGDKQSIGHEGMIDVPFQKLAAQVGGAIMANTLAAGLIAALLGLDAQEGSKFVDAFFGRKSEDIRAKNKAAFLRGHQEGRAISAQVPIEIQKDPAVASHVMMTGNEAVSMGALAGGVKYVVAYPMSPGTAVIEHLAAYSKDFDVLVEQVEDEIGVVNMALGAWYAGARTLVTTSGGGFALMVEGVSLSGMAEIPLVVHIAQRPGPATGLPTRTLQGDLFLAAFAGHGDFPRLVLAPGTLKEAFELSASAFELADRFQVPVFLLSDQYLLESYYDTPAFDASSALALADRIGQRALEVSRAMEAAVAATEGRKGGRSSLALATRYDGPLAGPGFPTVADQKSGTWIVPTTSDYQRAVLGSDGISPRGIPGYGNGVVTADSDEHDQTGHITEDLRLRNDMVHKRAAKTQLLRQSLPLPEVTGPSGAGIAVVGWGSTKDVIALALDKVRVAHPDFPVPAQIHFTFLNPLPDGLEALLGSYKKLILVENNEGAWLGKLIRMETGVHLPDPILRYDGLPFSVEGLAQALAERLGDLDSKEN